MKVEQGVDRNTYKELLKTGIKNVLDGNQADTLWAEHDNMDEEGDSESAPESSSEDDNK
jgi:hypothetical protein